MCTHRPQAASRFLCKVLHTHRRTGFTLIEMLLVVGIIGSLASVVIEAIGPKKMLLSAMDASRRQTVRELQTALVQYQIDEGTLPNIDDIIMADDGAKPICKEGVTLDATCVNIDGLIPEYLAALPQDNSETNANYTGYKIYREPVGGRPQIVSAHLGGLNDGLIGYWPFQEGAGTAAMDQSGKGNNGIVVGAPAWVDGKFGKAIQFVGNTAQYVQVTDNPLFSYGTNGVTYAAWIYPTAVGATHSMFMGETLPYFSFYNTRRVYFSIRDGSNVQRTLTSTTILPFNQWYHVAGVFDASGYQRLYINGVQNIVSPNAYTTPHYVYNTTHFIGKYTTTPNYPFSGIIDEVRIYNRGLSATEIAALARGQVN